MQTRSLLLDTESWDLTLDDSGNIAITDNPYSVAQDVACACSTPTNGNTIHSIVDDENYVQPYPEYEIKYVIPAPIRVYVDVSLANSDYLPADIETQVKSVIAQAFNGEDGGTRARIASTLFAGRYYSGVYNIDTSSVDIYNITLSRDGTTYSTSISFGIDEIPTLDADNISVKLVGS
ncbi:hypothetical protein [Photorhabdus akhurstii]|uniref:hypothetical protein n=1 Tax=Photorhabdus akhurstii TaxID=171438 RepID=UPI0037041919